MSKSRNSSEEVNSETLASATIYGYARCSTSEDKQDINRQKRELRRLGVTDDTNIYWEYEKGTVRDREALKKLFKTVKPGDTIIATEVSRLTRSTSHLCEIMDFIQQQKLCLIIDAFVVDCRAEKLDAMTKGMIMMWGVFAEMERDIISQRVKSGMENAKAKGKRIGRPTFTKEDIPSKFWEKYHLYQKNEISISDMARMLQLSRTTIYKYIEAAEN